jgi:hypothetical protein
MGNAIPTRHPAVVLRSHYRQVRALLAVTMIAVVGLTTAVVILATNDDRGTGAGSAAQVIAPTPTDSTRDDDGREQGSRGVVGAQPPSARYDGGPEEGTRGALSSGAPSSSAPRHRYDGGPEEGTRGALSSRAPSSAVPLYRYDGGPGPVDSEGSGR